MPIESIQTQPAANAIRAAYRPVIFLVRAKRTDNEPQPPVVYCDVYFNDVFYKTLAKTQYKQLNVADSDWQFDIQDACQEYLGKKLGSNGGSDIIKANEIYTQVTCRFRSSGYDVNGFIQPEDDAPVQGTGKYPPVAGTGTPSNDFYVINCTLQHQNNQDLAAHLGYFKAGVWSSAYPLTHRQTNYKISKGQSDYYPIMYVGNGQVASIKLFYRNKGQTVFNELTNNAVNVVGAADNFGAYLIPAGPANLAALFPAIDWDNLSDYYVQVRVLSDGDYVVIATSVVYKLCSCAADETIRVHFLSYCGTYDGANFIRPRIIHEDSANDFTKGLSFPLQKTDTGIERFNVKSNDTYEVRRKCLQGEMIWLQECKDSPKAFMEWTGTEGQSNDYLPIVIMTGKMEKLKNDREYDYEFVLQFRLSNEYITIRN